MSLTMKMRIVTMLAAACAAAPCAVRAQKTPDLAPFDKYVAQAARDWRVPGLAIAVVHDDSLVFAKGYGVLEIGKSAPTSWGSRRASTSTRASRSAPPPRR